jgi:hypothetical protein
MRGPDLLAHLSCFGGIVILLALPIRGGAQTCTGGEVSTPADGRVLGPFALGTSGAPTSIDVGFWVESGRSYSVEANNNPGPGPIGLNVNSIPCPGFDQGAVGVFVRDITSVSPVIQANGGIRKSIVVNAFFNGTSFPGFVRVFNGSASSASASISVTETTQFSPAWSTNGTYDTFYSLFNTTNSTCNIMLVLFDSTGAVQPPPFSASLPAGSTASTNTAAIGIARNKVGTAILTHDCPPGGILSEAAIANFRMTPAYIQGVKFSPVHAVH